MFISQALASAGDMAAAAGAGAPPSTTEAVMLNLLLIVILVVMFYVLLIMPQQKRFRKHRDMLGGLKRGDKIVTSSGFLGTIDNIQDGNDEVVIDLGNGIKVTALRSAIMNRANDN